MGMKGEGLKCPFWAFDPPNIIEFLSERSPLVNLPAHTHIPTSLVLKYAFGKIPETADDDEEAERTELVLNIWIIRVNSSPNVGYVLGELSVLVPLDG